MPSAPRTNYAQHTMTADQVQTARKQLRFAIDRSMSGNLSELARRCRVTPQAVQSWVSRGVVPAARVMQVVAAVEGKIDAEVLRPDIFTRPAA